MIGLNLIHLSQKIPIHSKKRSIFANHPMYEDPTQLVLMTKPNSMQHSENEGLPPFVKTWPHMYLIVMGTLLLMIFLFYAFMITFQ